jgi:DNA-3-methyladenine glycosylase I
VKNKTTASSAARPQKIRCSWCLSDPEYIRYHDEEWGRPVHDDRILFEFLILEGAQAGLSWLTILKRRAGYRRAFQGFDPKKVARMTEADVQRLLQDEGIIRHGGKIRATIGNAKAFLEIQREFGSFDAYCWGFVGGSRLNQRRKSQSQLPATTPESDTFSKDLKRRGFKFVGSTIMYAFMQAVGMVDDHVDPCFRAQRRKPASRKPTSRRSTT